MAKVVKTLVADDGLNFDYITSFKTENYIGLYNRTDGSFVLINSSDSEFYIHHIDDCDNLEELDDEVYGVCEEHIKEVFENQHYRLILDEGD